MEPHASLRAAAVDSNLGDEAIKMEQAGQRSWMALCRWIKRLVREAARYCLGMGWLESGQATPNAV